jgi:methylthioribose-1-phosphate isomerase
MDEKIKSIWWQVRPVLVLDQNDWPNQGGTSGITSFADMQKAIKAKAAVEAPSNFFLFFSSYLH